MSVQRVLLLWGYLKLSTVFAATCLCNTSANVTIL